MKIKRLIVFAAILAAGCGPLTPAQLDALRAVAESAPAPEAPLTFPDYTAGYSPAPNPEFIRPAGPGPVLGCDHCSPLSPQAQWLLDMGGGHFTPLR